MGTYLNPGNSGFESIVNSDYVDKTGIIGLVNRTMGTTRRLTCVSRPRRFGKSFAAQALCAYYDRSVDSSTLFEGLDISRDETYAEHLNRYDVIYVDMTNIIGKTRSGGLVRYIEEAVGAELLLAYPDVKPGMSFDETLVRVVERTGRKFVMVIDEWDAPIREHPERAREYLRFLRMLFKSSGTTAKVFAAAYMTGILPIKKDGSQSAISDFHEYTMLEPLEFAPYVGFTEGEVRSLCEEHGVDFAEMKRWYDGYSLPGVPHVYNPNSVMRSLQSRRFASYWTQTSAADGLMSYISHDYTGLAKTVAELIGGVDVAVDPIGFANDLVSFRDADDVLTLMVHLGYLAYDEETGRARIPNEEIRQEFGRAVRLVDHAETSRRLRESDQLLVDTVEGNEEAVAAQIERVHREECDPLHYNREEDLRSTIKLAYYTYRDHYLRLQELSAGDGYADVVYLPKPGEGLPALVVELKCDGSADGAIAQILDRRYPEALEGFGGDVLLVGVSYDRKTRMHSCRIQRA